MPHSKPKLAMILPLSVALASPACGSPTGGPNTGNEDAGPSTDKAAGAGGTSSGGRPGATGGGGTGGLRTDASVRSPAGGSGGIGGLGGNDSAARDAGIDASAVDGSTGTTGDGGNAALGDGGDNSTAIGALGQPCSSNGAYACAGHAQKGQLVCSQGEWTSLGVCSGSSNCDTAPGSSAGSCQPIVAECAGMQPGDLVCKGQDVEECGPDLVTTSVTETCTDQACVDGACQGTCEPETSRCKSLQPQTCDAAGAWQDNGAACPNVCSGGACSGTCMPTAKRCNGKVPQTCDETGTWQDGTACTYACTGAGNCTGVCSPGGKRCSSGGVQTCSSTGQWGTAAACAYHYCQGGTCKAPPSCQGLASNCGPSGNESCCDTATTMPSGTFPMGRGTENCSSYPGGCTSGCPSNVSCSSVEQPEHDVTVSAFVLDKYEVTVGRFRKFVAAYNAWRGAGHPANGEGAGLAGTGWKSAWDADLAATPADLTTNLKCNSTDQTWTDSAGGNETKAINCVSWYEAFAFCLWDGGRLPTEAEWEYGAAGGGQNRLFPWGSAEPSCTYANMSGCAGAVTSVGSASAGAGRWGHLDLAGNVWEWTFDWYDGGWYSKAGAAGSDVVNLTTASNRVLRGGFFGNDAGSLRAAYRAYSAPTYRDSLVGFRCARTP